MSPVLPIILLGDNLGQRHKNLNALVDRVFHSDVSFQAIQSIQEQLPVDRIFKIDVASKLRDIDYIIQNLKDDDMLYVSKALKCKWLLENEYQNVINPDNVEKNLYPYMITTAVSKMKCWLSVHLRDEERCQKFYVYYYDRNFNLAIRFLTHCKDSYILDETPKILDKLDPFYLKVFCEKDPQVARIYFDALSSNKNVFNRYVEKDVEYFDSLKVVLKSDGNVFLDIIEKYFNNNKFNRLSPGATKYIVSHYKDRFSKKIELYAAWLLNMKSLAQCLTVDECKELTLTLARAEYLSQWFTYQNVEPLIKRVPAEQRSAFKNKIFVDKDGSEKVREWQYETPSQPSFFKEAEESDSQLFDDITHSPHEYEICDFHHMLKKRKYCKWDMVKTGRKTTVLDQLFNEFRFSSFENTLYEIRRRIAIESSSQNRQFMMLVLVSKTGGRAESVASLLQLLERHQNEPVHVRATIVRSLTKRAFVWRLPQNSWESLMVFTTGLGLDGKEPEADCPEGLHAVVLRNLLGNGCIEECIFSAFMKQFSTLKEYSLTAIEQKAVTERLPALLLASIVNEDDTEKQAEVFNFLFQTLDDFNLPIDTFPIVPALVALANKNLDNARSLLFRLFNAKKARRELFEQNFACMASDDSYLNALRHNTELLKWNVYVNRAINEGSCNEKFFRKLAIYFAENNGLADLYLSALKESLTNKQDVKLTRPLALLIGSELESYLRQFNGNDDKAVRRFLAALKANVHLARPKLNIETFGHHAIGPKAVATVMVVSRYANIENHVATLIKWPRTVRLALVLSERLNMQVQTLAIIAKIRPKVALKSGLKYIYRNVNFSQDVWEIVRPIIKEYDFESQKTSHLRERLWDFKKIPKSIQPEYCTILYAVARKVNQNIVTVLPQIENLLPKINCEFVEDFLSQFLHKDFAWIQDSREGLFHKKHFTCLCLRIFVKFLLLSKSDEIRDLRYEKYGEPILKLISTSKREVATYFEEILKTLRYNAVFFNQEYVSCMPVFVRVVSWMHTFFPVDKFFRYHVEIHLTMLFYKSVRQCLKHNPKLLDNKKKFENAVVILGSTFGKYIAKELDELKSSYFESIVELYHNVLDTYLDDYFAHDFMKQTFFINIVRGIVDYGENTIPLLGIYLLDKIYNVNDNAVAKEMKANLHKTDNQELQFFLDNGED